jgi:hypothetical protein
MPYQVAFISWRLKLKRKQTPLNFQKFKRQGKHRYYFFEKKYLFYTSTPRTNALATTSLPKA